MTRHFNDQYPACTARTPLEQPGTNDGEPVGRMAVTRMTVIRMTVIRSMNGLALALIALTLIASACGGDDDTTPPNTPDGLSVTATGRVSVSIEWTAPADDDGDAVAAYELRVSRGVPFSAEGFSDEGTLVATGTPGQPGDLESAIFENVRPGWPHHIGLVAIDDAGNRSELAITLVNTSMSQSGSIVAPNLDDDDNALGFQIEPGEFNGDGYGDIVVAAPFKRVVDVLGAGAVYVYFGQQSGINDTPDMTLQGTQAGGQFGNAVAVLDWNGDGAHDIAVGAPFGDSGHGRVYIFFGDGRFSPGATLSDTDADVVVSADPASPWFGFSALGWTLSAGRFDSDARDDLAIAAVGADTGIGAVVWLYGGTAAAGDITLSELDPGLMNAAVAHVLFAPGVAQNAFTLFGSSMANLGENAGAGGTDQLGIAFFQGADAYVMRGRATRPQDPGVHELFFDQALDLQLVADPLDADTYFASPMAAGVDMNGDGVRDLMFGSYLEGDEAGRVYMVLGETTGVQAIDALPLGIEGAPGERFGSAFVNNGAYGGAADIDGDGVEDLVVVGGSGQVSLYVWYGGNTFDIMSSDNPDYIIDAPTEFTAATPAIGGTPSVVRAVGDINGDGLTDIAWADWANNNRDGALELLY